MAGEPRTRSMSTQVLTEPLRIDFVTGGSDTTTGNFVVSQWQKSISDVVVPGYNRRVKNGEVFNNPMSFGESSIKSDGFGQGHYKQNAPGKTEYFLLGPLSNQRAQNVDVYRDVRPTSFSTVGDSVSRALSRIDSTPQSHTEDVLELGETIRLLRNPTKALADLAKEFSREVRKGSAKAIAKRSADVYAQYRFGFAPLVRSVHEVLANYDEQPQRPPDRRVAHGRFQNNHHKAFSSKFGTIAYSVFSVTWSQSYSEHTAIMYEVTNPIYDWRWKYGLRNKDLPVGFWNVVPLSFVVDRAYDVSSLVRGVTNLLDPAVRILSANTTKRTEVIKSYQLVSEYNPGWQSNASGNAVTEKFFSMSRTPFVPTVKDAVPKLTLQGLVRDSTSIADLAALIIQRLK